MPAATTTSRRLLHQRRSTALPPICSGEGSIRPGGAGRRRRPRMRSAHRPPESREQQLAAEQRRINKRVAGATPLMYACQQARDQHVRALLQEKPERVFTRDRTMKSALHYCAENATPASAELVLAAAPDLLDAKDDDGFTPLHLAVIAGNVGLVRFLLQRHADLSALDNESHSVVHWATVCGEVDALEALLDAGAEASTPDIHGGYPLHYAAQMCGVNSEMGNDPRAGLFVLRTLLARDVDVHVKDQDGRQPILWAASAGSADAVLALVNAGADVEADDKDGLTALHCAASRGHTECLETLVTLCGAEVNVIDSNGCTALFYAVTLGHADCTQLLLNFGAEPNRQDRKGRTAAHCGAAKGQLETLKLLGSAGADLWTRNVKGDLPLHEAVQSGRRELVRWLLAQRPDSITAANNDGRTALHVAAVNNNVEMCKIVIDGESLVNPVMRGTKGQMMTPLDAALLRGNRGCAKYLQLHGGVPASKLTEEAAAIRGPSRPVSDSRLGGTASPASDLMLLTPRGELISATPSPRTSVSIQMPAPSDQTTQTHEEMFPDQPPTISESGSARHKTRRVRTKSKSPALQPPASSSDSEVASEAHLGSSRRRRSSRRGTAKVKRKSADDKIKKQPVLEKQVTVVAAHVEEKLQSLETESAVDKQSTIEKQDQAITENNPEVSGTDGDKQSSLERQTEVTAAEVHTSSLSKSDDKPSSETKDTSKSGSSDSNKTAENTVEEAEKVIEKKEIENNTKSSEQVINSSTENNTEIPAQTSSSQENSQNQNLKLSINESDNQTVETTNAETKQNQDEENRVNEAIKIEISEDYDIKNKTVEAYKETEIIENKISENSNSEQISETVQPEQDESKQEIAPENKKEDDAINDDKTLHEDETKTAETAKNGETVTKEEEHIKSSPEGTENKTSDEDNNKTAKTDNSESSVPPLKTEKLKKKNLVNKKQENHVEATKAKKTRRKVEIDKQSTSNSEKDDAHVREARPQPKARSKSREGKKKPETKQKKDARNKELKVARKSSEEDQKSTESSFTSESSTRSKAADSGVMLIDSLSGSPQLPRNKAHKTVSQVTPRKVTERRLQLRAHQHDVKDDARKAREILRQRQQQSVVSVTQAVQVSTRKYQLERRIFQELLELKRLQIRAGRSNEQVLVKRAVDEYRSAGLIVGLRQYDGPYNFRDFEQYLYEQLTVLQQSADAHLVARLKPSDDVESLSAALRRSLPGMPGALHHSAAFCTLSTHRCRHATEAYTGMPVATYVSRQSAGSRISPESFLPRIEASPSRGTPAPPRSASRSLHQVDPSRPVTLELSHGGEKQVISLPTERLDRTKRYYVTFTIKPGDGQATAVANTGSEDQAHRHAKSL